MSSNLVSPLDILFYFYRRRNTINKETISFKMEDYTITLHRGEEEPEETEQEWLYMQLAYPMLQGNKW